MQQHFSGAYPTPNGDQCTHLAASKGREHSVFDSKNGFPPNRQEDEDPRQTNQDGKNIRVALLTGADDRPYAVGLASSLLALGTSVDFVGSDTVNCPELDGIPLLNFLNFRGFPDIPGEEWLTSVPVPRNVNDGGSRR